MSFRPRRGAAIAVALATGLLCLTALAVNAQDPSPDASLDPTAGVVPTPAPSLTADEARVRMLNGSPDGSSMDVYLDGSMVEGLSGVSFGAISDYLVVPAGSHDVSLFDSGADSSTDEPRYTGSLSFEGWLDEHAGGHGSAGFAPAAGAGRHADAGRQEGPDPLRPVFG